MKPVKNILINYLSPALAFKSLNANIISAHRGLFLCISNEFRISISSTTVTPSSFMIVHHYISKTTNQIFFYGLYGADQNYHTHIQKHFLNG